MKHLVKVDDKMILLFTPAFDKTQQNPGYIKGYLPGVRENGGQYTHGALWTALAFAKLGDGEKAVELLQLLNPVEHARNTEQAERYKVEPYVVCADVYALEGQVGRGGWTWYTGSSSWMYRVWIEEVLGFQLRGDRLLIDPTIPGDWPEFTIRYRFRNAHYSIHVLNPEGVSGGVAWVEIDGERQSTNAIPLVDDGASHAITVCMGPPIDIVEKPLMPTETAEVEAIAAVGSEMADGAESAGTDNAEEFAEPETAPTEDTPADSVEVRAEVSEATPPKRKGRAAKGKSKGENSSK